MSLATKRKCVVIADVQRCWRVNRKIWLFSSTVVSISTFFDHLLFLRLVISSKLQRIRYVHYWSVFRCIFYQSVDRYLRRQWPISNAFANSLLMKKCQRSNLNKPLLWLTNYESSTIKAQLWAATKPRLLECS